MDLPHAAEYLGTVAAGVGGEGSAAARAWQTEHIAILRAQGAAPVLAASTALQAAAPENAALSKPAEYLRKRAGQMAYPAFRAAGWPLGSGIVESANKLVVEARLKGAGLGWGTTALNPMLALRNAVGNGRWGEAWATVQAGQQAAQRARRGGGESTGRGGATGPAGAGARTDGAVNAAGVAEVEAILARGAAELEQERAEAAPHKGKPGPRHPWRHASLSKAR